LARIKDLPFFRSAQILIRNANGQNVRGVRKLFATRWQSKRSATIAQTDHLITDD
jgi:hypothetical protein